MEGEKPPTVPFTTQVCLFHTEFGPIYGDFGLESEYSNENVSEVANYCVGGVPVGDGAFDNRKAYQGDLVRLTWHSIRNENQILNSDCLLSPPTRSYHSSWIAVIIEDRTTHPGCSLPALLNQSASFTNASAVLFLRDAQTAFNKLEPSFTPYSSPSHIPLFRHYPDRRQQSQRSGLGGPTPSKLIVSLPLDMFPDLPGQLAVASTSNQVAVIGHIELFAESLSNSNSSNNKSGTVTDLSSSLLLLLIVCVLFLLLGMLLVPARLGICFWQRLCCIPMSRSAESRRSRKLTAATKKALKQLPVKCLDQVDNLISEGFDQCAICIEIFKPHDLIRSLPCRHMYHRACIDPWLLKHRSCPLCKQNVLIACGLSLTEEDMESCSASASEVNSAFSLSASSSPSSMSSVSLIDGVFCFPLLSISNCRRGRRHHLHHRRRQYHGEHPYRDFDHLRRPSSSLDEVSAPSGARRVLGSASENSSSSITARSIPSDLYFHGNPRISSEKGARFVVEEYDEEDDSSAGRGGQRRGRRFFMPRRHERRTVHLVNSCCGCYSGTRYRAEKERAVGGIPPPPPPPLPLSPSSCGAAVMYPPTVAHPSAMLLYHLPRSLPFGQIPAVTKAALPSYEQSPQNRFLRLSSDGSVEASSSIITSLSGDFFEVLPRKKPNVVTPVQLMRYPRRLRWKCSVTERVAIRAYISMKSCFRIVNAILASNVYTGGGRRGSGILATAAMPQAAFVAIPGPLPCPHQAAPITAWNLHFTTETNLQTSDRLFDPHPPNHSGAKTNVVYAVLSNSTARTRRLEFGVLLSSSHESSGMSWLD
ncbi:hypothetical protein Aperf_G00000128657 [Anoplocephala perfoliata]